MLSSRINPNDTDDDEEGESTMPGDYEPWPRAPSRTAPGATVPPTRPSVPPLTPRPNQRSSSAATPKPWPPVRSGASPVRRRRTRRRPLTPEIVIEREHRRHLSSGRNRIITIPLDNRPTLGLRGPPKRVLEIERVRCCRRRKRRSSCYEIDYEDPLPSNFMYANPPSNPYLLPAQPSLMVPTNNSASWLTTFSNLTPEIIENLPRQTVHLPPIHLPGSQADTNTELDTVVFPAEIINPIDGTLSIIQSDPATYNGRNAVVQSPVAVPVQSQFINNASANTQSPLEMLTMASGPFMQQVHDLFQRITLSQSQPTSSPYNQAPIQPSLPVVPQYNAATNSFYNGQTIPPLNTTNIRPYPPANIQPTVVPNSGSYNATISTPANSANTTSYPPANITPYHRINNTQSNPANITPYAPANITPYRPANITPYTPLSNTPYRSANITPYQPTTTSNFTPSNPINTRSYSGTGLEPSRSSDIGPYSPANITPYSVGTNRSGGNSMLPSSIPPASTPYIPSSSLGSSDSFNSSSSGINNRPLNIPHSSQSPSQTPYQSNTSMPKSILRNASSNRPFNTTYTRFNPSSVLSSNGIVRERVTAV